jgi:hypothetical protein
LVGWRAPGVKSESHLPPFSSPPPSPPPTHSADKQHAAREEPPTQYVLSAATIPTYGLKSVEELVKKRFPRAVRVSTDLMHRHHPRLTQAFFEVGFRVGEWVKERMRWFGW